MIIAILSDKFQMRGIFCVIFGCVSIIGYGVLLSDSAPGVHYFGCFLVAGGLYVVVGLPIAWVSLKLSINTHEEKAASNMCIKSCPTTPLGMAKEQLQRVCSLLLETPLESCLHSYSKSLTPKGVCWYLDNTVFINSRRHVALRSINLASFAAMPSRSAWSAWESAYMAFSGTRFGRRTSAVMRESCRENMRVCWRRSSRSWETTVLITDIRFNAKERRYRILHW